MPSYNTHTAPVTQIGQASSPRRSSMPALPSFISGAIVLAGLTACLHFLAGVSLVVAALLALISAIVTVHVFSLAGESAEA